MLANKIGTTVLDIDANQVENVRKFGFKVFFGDAKRIEVLNTAGLSHAKVLVLAIDDSEAALQIAGIVHTTYPNIKILMRVHSRTHVYDAIKKGVSFENIYRETFDSALNMATNTLTALGFEENIANNLTVKFKQTDEESLLKMTNLYDGKITDDYISEVKKTMGDYITQSENHNKELEEILTADLETMDK